jgi:hypothetical protein
MSPGRLMRPGFCFTPRITSTPSRAEPKFNQDLWQAEVTKMIKAYGAPIDDGDVPKIADYLAATY